MFILLGLVFWRFACNSDFNASKLCLKLQSVSMSAVQLRGPKAMMGGWRWHRIPGSTPRLACGKKGKIKPKKRNTKKKNLASVLITSFFFLFCSDKGQVFLLFCPAGCCGWRFFLASFLLNFLGTGHRPDDRCRGRTKRRVYLRWVVSGKAGEGRRNGRDWEGLGRSGWIAGVSGRAALIWEKKEEEERDNNGRENPGEYGDFDFWSWVCHSGSPEPVARVNRFFVSLELVACAAVPSACVPPVFVHWSKNLSVRSGGG